MAKTTFKTGETIQIRWKNAPGYRHDYIRIIPADATKSYLEESVRLYTHAQSEGSIQYNASNVNGNWTAWNKSKSESWPLRAGNYKVELVLDDSQEVLATMQISIHRLG